MTRPPSSPLWRSLEESGGRDDAALVREFPALAALPPLDRRAALRVMGASLALAGVGGCDWTTDEQALPYVVVPDGETLGSPRYYATALTFAGGAVPVVGKTYDGRPVKLDGNPGHPEWQGASDVFLQAALLGLYDPDRSRTPRHLDRPTDWALFEQEAFALAGGLDASGGAGFAILTGAISSPTLERQLDALLERWPAARRFVHEPFGNEGRLRAAEIAFGRPLATRPDLEQAEVVVSLGDDLLGPGHSQAPNARGWAARRAAWRRGEGGSRLFVAEATPGITGAMAEARLPVEPARLAVLARGLAAALGGEAVDGPAEEREWVADAARALRAHPGRALVTAGPDLAPEIQAVAMILTARLGGVGATLRCTEPPPAPGTLRDLTAAMETGAVETLVILGTNPRFTVPAASPFHEAFSRVPLRIHAGTHRDETAVDCHWHLPLAHELESWGDARSADGTVSIIQPLVRPMHGGRSLTAILGGLLGSSADGREAVRETWRAAWGEDFEVRWSDALVRGYVPGTAAPDLRPEPRALPDLPEPPPDAGEALVAVARPHPSVWDGRFAGNAWLEETPAPLDKVTWGNVVAVSPALAAERGIAAGDTLRLRVGDRVLTGPYPLVYSLNGQ